MVKKKYTKLWENIMLGIVSIWYLMTQVVVAQFIFGEVLVGFIFTSYGYFYSSIKYKFFLFYFQKIIQSNMR